MLELHGDIGPVQVEHHAHLTQVQLLARSPQQNAQIIWVYGLTGVYKGLRAGVLHIPQLLTSLTAPCTAGGAETELKWARLG